MSAEIEKLKREVRDLNIVVTDLMGTMRNTTAVIEAMAARIIADAQTFDDRVKAVKFNVGIEI